MRRGEIWTVSGGRDYASKKRPVVILQDDRFDATESVTVCGLTSVGPSDVMFRVALAPSAGNGLRAASHIMVDKITTVQRAKLGVRIGQVEAGDLMRINQAVMVFLGIAGRVGQTT